MPHLRLTVEPELPEDLSPYDVVVTLDTARYTNNHKHLREFVEAGGGWIGLVHRSEKPLPEIFGAHRSFILSGKEKIKAQNVF